MTLDYDAPSKQRGADMAEKQKNKKQGRCRKSMQNLRYINEGRHNRSHVRRIAAHLVRFPGDVAASAALQLYKIKAGIITTRRT
jgi:hypothetical protein